jgi:serine protease Do
MKGACVVIAIVAVLAWSPGHAQTIEALEKEITQMVDRVSGSIVSISAVTDLGGKAVSRSVGCGVVFDASGLVLTTASIVGRAGEVDVVSSGGERYRGEVVGLDPASDLAVVKVTGANLRPAAMSRDRALRPGSWIFLLGNAFGSLPSVSMGMVSGLASPVRDDLGGEMLRLSVAMNPGDTGAPVVNSRGEVVGIAVGRISFNPWSYSACLPDATPYGLGGLQPSGMSVAVPAERAVAIAREIVATGGKERGFLGVRVVELSDEMKADLGDRGLRGVVVTDVVASSPAESVGIAAGDVITAFGTREIRSARSLLESVGATRPGDVVAIKLVRGSEALTEHVRIGPFLSDYLRQQAMRPQARPEDLGARIEYMKSEIERLKAGLKQLEGRK